MAIYKDGMKNVKELWLTGADFTAEDPAVADIISYNGRVQPKSLDVETKLNAQLPIPIGSQVIKGVFHFYSYLVTSTLVVKTWLYKEITTGDGAWTDLGDEVISCAGSPEHLEWEWIPPAIYSKMPSTNSMVIEVRMTHLQVDALLFMGVKLTYVEAS